MPGQILLLLEVVESIVLYQAPLSLDLCDDSGLLILLQLEPLEGLVKHHLEVAADAAIFCRALSGVSPSGF